MRPAIPRDMIHSRVEEGRMRQAVPITLEAGDRRQLQRHIRSRRSAVRLVERAKIVLLAAAGNNNNEIRDHTQYMVLAAPYGSVAHLGE